VDEADRLPGIEVPADPDLAQLHGAACRILYRHYHLQAEAPRDAMFELATRRR